jgi:hypothetical protein
MSVIAGPGRADGAQGSVFGAVVARAGNAEGRPRPVDGLFTGYDLWEHVG